jgi:hypothetical protein
VGVAVRLFSPRLRVVPGNEAAVEVRIRNTGILVDQVDLTVLGEPAAWATLDPPRLNLLPGQDGAARLTFAPPRSSDVAAGDRPYAVRAASREDPDGSSAEEAVLEVAEFELVVAELVPRASRAPRAGRHELAVDNLSNHPLVLTLVASDPDEVLDFRLDSTRFTAVPGTSTFVRLRARPTTRFLRGSDKALPFEIAILAGETELQVVPGTVRQHAIVPGWLFRAGLAFTLIAALWVAVLKPKLDEKVQTIAQEEAIKATDPLTPKVNTLVKKDDEAAAAAAKAAAAPRPPTPAPKKTPKPGTTPTPAPTPTASPAPTDATAAPAPTVTVTATPVPGPLPSRELNFYKAGWVATNAPQTLGPPMPSRSETVVRITEIYVESPYQDHGTVRINGLTPAGGFTPVVLDGETRSVHVTASATARYDEAHPILAVAECTGTGSSNPGPPGGTETPTCKFEIFFRGFTEAGPLNPATSNSTASNSTASNSTASNSTASNPTARSGQVPADTARSRRSTTPGSAAADTRETWARRQDG